MALHTYIFEAEMAERLGALSLQISHLSVVLTELLSVAASSQEGKTETARLLEA